MPRRARNAPGGLVYHVLNRAVARLPLFQKDDDFLAFERIMAEALQGRKKGTQLVFGSFSWVETSCVPFSPPFPLASLAGLLLIIQAMFVSERRIR